ncbi:MAG TPA: Txe/YoeB family addiction module toxin [Hanamia sp.]|jgi:toxin YoeB
MQIIFEPEAKEDLDFFIKSGNKIILRKVTKLIEAITENPFEGLGKPEPLKYELAGTWSRRINQEHRLIYEITDKKIIIHSLRGHYD